MQMVDKEKEENSEPVPGIPPVELKRRLSEFISPNRILVRPIDLVAFASDASFYRLMPQAVVLAANVDEIRSLFSFSRLHQIPITFRAAGTSLSGQAVTSGILVEVARFWRRFEILDGGARVRVEPGVIGGHVNQSLARYHRKLGPDPASISACTLGGILSNNSSGMCCGVAQNAYHTLESMKFLLPSGTCIDTSATNADDLFRVAEPAVAEGILALRRRLQSNPTLCQRIRSKYQRKNTTGYSLNSFVDFERPVDILQHLLIGAEGTLGFIAEAVLQTVPDFPWKYTGILFFPDLYAAAAAVPILNTHGARAIEIMDRLALRSVENQPGFASTIRSLPGDACSLLVEFHASAEAEMPALKRAVKETVARLPLLQPSVFTDVPEDRATLWKIRSGMFPSVGATREGGTTVIIEDVGFPVENLADAATDLRELFVKHGYSDAILFGHAKDGNLHFVLSQTFNHQRAIDQYARFMDDVVKLVVGRYDGALKAEHGTGRNMAPFVEAEWGREAYQLMKELKGLVDPANLLNPAVIIAASRTAHIENLKPLPRVEEEVDKCIECGYCEPRCPSRELTLTPRQRIAVRREMTRLKESGEDARAHVLSQDYEYMGLDTCAADGMCATACPVQIDTGQLVKQLRSESHSKMANRCAAFLAEHFAMTETAVRWSLRIGHLGEKIAGRRVANSLSRAFSHLSKDALPAWQSDMPLPAPVIAHRAKRSEAHGVYFPSCVSRTMGRSPNEPECASIQNIFLELASRAGKPVFIPEDVRGTCCGTPFSSKGFRKAHEIAVNRAISRMWHWSERGRLPVVVDTSPCTYGFRAARPYLTAANQALFDRLKILDSIEYVHDQLLPRLRIKRKFGKVALHPVCSVKKLRLDSRLEAIARACSHKAVTPASAECCGFAGDRGFLFPELTASATRAEASEISATQYDGYFSSSRTCEIAMTRATNQMYRSYLYMVHSATEGSAAETH